MEATQLAVSPSAPLAKYAAVDSAARVVGIPVLDPKFDTYLLLRILPLLTGWKTAILLVDSGECTSPLQLLKKPLTEMIDTLEVNPTLARMCHTIRIGQQRHNSSLQVSIKEDLSARRNNMMQNLMYFSNNTAFNLCKNLVTEVLSRETTMLFR